METGAASGRNPPSSITFIQELPRRADYAGCMTSLVPASPRPFVALSDFRFRLWPILFAAILMQGLLELGRVPARGLYRAGETLWVDHVSVFLLLAIAFQALLGLAAVLVMRRLLPAADAHLRWPPGRSYVGVALLLGFGMGLIMLVADYWPALAAQTAPDMSYSEDTARFGGLPAWHDHDGARRGDDLSRAARRDAGRPRARPAPDRIARPARRCLCRGAAVRARPLEVVHHRSFLPSDGAADLRLCTGGCSTSG